MKKLALLCTLALAGLAAQADDTFIFVDKNGNTVPDGATVTITEATDYYDPETGETALMFDSGLSVLNTTSQSAAIALNYAVNTLDGGLFQLCFPIECTVKETTGNFRTGSGIMKANESRSLGAEWISLGTGKCVATLQIDVQRASSSFPPTYTHVAYGPKITIVFDADPAPVVKGDVNGDKLLSGADVTALYGKLLDGKNVDGNPDVNGDGLVSGADVTALYSLLLDE